jgi:predicted membrane protein
MGLLCVTYLFKICNVSLLKFFKIKKKKKKKKEKEKEKKKVITIGQYLQNFWNKELDYAQQTFVCPLM